MLDLANATSLLKEVMRPKTSGQTLNVHVVQSVRVAPPNFEQMRIQIQGGDAPAPKQGPEGKAVDE